MSKPSLANTASKTPPQLSAKNAWAKGPPQSHSSAPSPRSQSPAPPSVPSHFTHSRRPSGLGQPFPAKDPVTTGPRTNVVKQTSAVSFGSIDDPSANSPPVPIPKSDVPRSFSPAPSSSTTGYINGKPSTTKPTVASSAMTASVPATSSSSSSSSATIPASLKMNKSDVLKMFQSAPSSAPTSDPVSSSPSVRPQNLPPQQQHQQPSQQLQQAQPAPPQSQPSQLAYTPFVPGAGLRPQQQQNGPAIGPGPGPGPRSPVYPRPLANGSGTRPAGGPSGPGGAPQQMSAGLSSPRLAPHPHPGPPSGMPPPQIAVPGWPYYYPGMPPDQYMHAYPQQWYLPQHPVPHQPQHQPHQQQHQQQQQPPPQGPPGPPSHVGVVGMPMSPRHPPQPPLPVPGTPTPAHAVVSSAHSPHPGSPHHSSSSSSNNNNNSHNNSNNTNTGSNIGGLVSPPPTPSTAGGPHGGIGGGGGIGLQQQQQHQHQQQQHQQHQQHQHQQRLNHTANTFVPNRVASSKVTIKNMDGKEMSLEALKLQGPQQHQHQQQQQQQQQQGTGAGPSVAGAAALPSAPAHPSSASANVNRRSTSVRMESEEAKKQRLAIELETERVKKEKEEKERKEKEEKARKEKEEEERLKKEAEEKERERIRKEEEEKEKERLRKEEEEEEREQERLRKEEEERLERIKREEEEEKEKERIRKEEMERKLREEEEKERIRKEEEEERERLKQEEERERIRAEEEEEEAKAKAAAEADLTPTAKEIEEGELGHAQTEDTNDSSLELLDEKRRDREMLRIDTTTPKPALPAPDLPKKRPGPLDLSSASKTQVAAPLPSALATARNINDLGRVPYPEGILSPKVELNINTKDGKFRYDREFLLQFMSVCTEKPDMLPPLDAIGLEPVDQFFSLTRGGSGRHRQPSNPSVASSSNRPQGIGLGFNTFGKTGGGGGAGGGGAGPNPFNMNMGMGNFTTLGNKLNGEDRLMMPGGGGSGGGGGGGGAGGGRSASGPSGLAFGGGRAAAVARTVSQGGHGAAGGSSMGNNNSRTRSKRGEKRNDNNKMSNAGGGGQQQGHGSAFGYSGPMGPGGVPEPEPLVLSGNRWVPVSFTRKPTAVDPDSPEIVDRKVKGLLNKLTMEKFDSISDQIIAWANKSEKEKDGRTLIQVIRLVFEKATDEATWSEMYARLCRKMMEQISSTVQDDGIKNSEGKPITGGQLFRKYLLNRCQEDFERGWVAKEVTAAAAATKAKEDEAAKASNEKIKEGGGGNEEVALYSEEYYAAQKAKRQGLGLIKFIGELFKLQMLTERIMHECVKKLLGNVQNPEEEEIESLCKLLATVGSILDTSKARAHMDVYFSRMKELVKSPSVSSRMQFMLQDVIELRERRWITRNAVAAPTTIAQIHEAAAKEKAAQEKESYQRQMSMSRGGSRRGGDRMGDHQQQVDGWAVAGSSGPPRPPSKAGDLSNFGKINKPTSGQMTFGPGSVFAGKKEGKRESLSRSSSNSNMFSMLGPESEGVTDVASSSSSSKLGHVPRKASVDISQHHQLQQEAPQRRKIVLQPRSKPTVTEPVPEAASDSSSSSSEDEAVAPAAPAEVEAMSEAEAMKKIGEDSKEFFGVRNLDEAEEYFSTLPVEHRFRLVDKLVMKAIESKESDAQLVAEFFSRAAAKELCSAGSFEEGFMPTAEILDDIVIDVPKAFDLMAVMLMGAGIDRDEARHTRIASKLMDSDKLLALLS